MKEKLFCKNVLLVAVFFVVSVFFSTVVCPTLPQAWGQCIEDDSGALDIEGSCSGGTVTVRIQNAPNEVDAMGFEVTYDPSVLGYTGYDRGSCVAGWSFFDVTNPQPGVLRVGGFTTTPPIPMGTSCNVVELHFNVITDACGTLGLQALVDDLDGWSTSHGCVLCCGCDPEPEICDDQTDNDCDGLIDCADPDCAGVPPCNGDCVEDDSGQLDIVEVNCSGGTATARVRIQNSPNAVDAMGFEVTYDPSVLVFTGYTRGPCVADWSFFDVTTPAPGVLRVGGFTTTPPIPPGESCNVVELNFDVTGSCTQLCLQSLVDDLANWSTSCGCLCCDGDDVCIEDDSGQLDIMGASSTAGNPVTYTVRIQDAPNEVITLGFDISFPNNTLSYTGYDRGDCVINWDFFDCSNPEPGVVRCGGFTTVDPVLQGESCDVVDLHFDVIDCDPASGCLEGDKLNFIALYDQVEGWNTSQGCFCCGCKCDVNGDGIVTPLDALCAFEKFLQICPTTFCGECEAVCCDVSGENGIEPPDGQCTPFDPMCIFMEFLEMRPNCCSQ